MSAFWNRPSATTTIQPVMQLVTSRIYDISHWLSTDDKHVKIGLAIALPSVVLLLTTTPITNKLAQAWRRATGRTSPEIDAARPESVEHSTNDKPPELPMKSYGQLSSGKRAAGVERSEHNTNDKSPELPKKSYEKPSSRKRVARPEHSERVINNDNIVYNTNNHSGSSSSPASPKKSYAAAATTPTTTASVDPFSPSPPDTASITSDPTSSHSQKRKFRLGQTIKKKWQQNRPFGHHGSSESPLSP
ncbi:hypothetical protein Q7P35_001263 [Cladosporium inversicolor]